MQALSSLPACERPTLPTPPPSSASGWRVLAANRLRSIRLRSQGQQPWRTRAHRRPLLPPDASRGLGVAGLSRPARHWSRAAHETAALVFGRRRSHPPCTAKAPRLRRWAVSAFRAGRVAPGPVRALRGLALRPPGRSSHGANTAPSPWGQPLAVAQPPGPPDGAPLLATGRVPIPRPAPLERLQPLLISHCAPAGVCHARRSPT